MARFINKVSIEQYSFVLTDGDAAVQGEIASGDSATGELAVGAISTTLVPLGFFTETVTGDGTLTANVQFFEEIQAYWVDNDGVSPVTTPFTTCYITDGSSVQASSTGASAFGLVLAVDATLGVLVKPGVLVV